MQLLRIYRILKFD